MSFSGLGEGRCHSKVGLTKTEPGTFRTDTQRRRRSPFSRCSFSFSQSSQLPVAAKSSPPDSEVLPALQHGLGSADDSTAMSLGDWNVTSSFKSTQETNCSLLATTTRAKPTEQEWTTEPLDSRTPRRDDPRAEALEVVNDPHFAEEQQEEDDLEASVSKKARIDTGGDKTSRRPRSGKRDPDYVPPSKRPGVSHAKKKQPGHVKRPRNAFILFRSHFVSEKVIPKEVECDHRNISRIVSEIWRNTPEEEKTYWHNLADKEREEHHRLYPDYIYKPESRKKQVRKRNVKELPNAEEQCKEIAKMILTSSGGRLKPSDAAAMAAAGCDAGAPYAQVGSVLATSFAASASSSATAAATTTPAPKTRKRKARTAKARDAPTIEPVRLVHTQSMACIGLATSDSMPASSTRDDAEARPRVHAASSASTETVAPPLFGQSLGRRASSLPAEPFGDASGSQQQAAELDPQLTTGIAGLPHHDGASAPDATGLDAWQDHAVHRPGHGPIGAIDALASLQQTQQQQHQHQRQPQQHSANRSSLVRRKPRPSPFQLQRSHFGAFDDQVLPSATVDSFSLQQQQKLRAVAGRPRSAGPSAPNTASLLGDLSSCGSFHDPMLVSPMLGSAARRTSFATAFGSVTMLPSRAEFLAQSGDGSGADAFLPLDPTELFESATQAAVQTLHSEGLLAGFGQMDPHLTYPSIQHQHQQHLHQQYEAAARHSTDACGERVGEPQGDAVFRFSVSDLGGPATARRSSARSFSQSSLGAAARHWLSSIAKDTHGDDERGDGDHAVATLQFVRSRANSRSLYSEHHQQVLQESQLGRGYDHDHHRQQQQQQQHGLLPPPLHHYQHAEQQHLNRAHQQTAPSKSDVSHPHFDTLAWTEMPPPSVPYRHASNPETTAAPPRGPAFLRTRADRSHEMLDAYPTSSAEALRGNISHPLHGGGAPCYDGPIDVTTPIEVTLFDCDRYLGHESIAASVFGDHGTEPDAAIDPSLGAAHVEPGVIAQGIASPSVEPTPCHLTPLQMIMMQYQQSASRAL
ncbi:hypothetical protein ACQY0O_005682 [Thecaphora frezii]